MGIASERGHGRAAFRAGEKRGFFRAPGPDRRAGLDGDPALVSIAEIIHELDIGDGKFDRPEAAGLDAMLSGVCASSEDDLERIARGGDALDQFHAYFSSRKGER